MRAARFLLAQFSSTMVDRSQRVRPDPQHGEINIRDGRVVESNFHDYEMLRMADMPKVETVIMPSGEVWGGVGEPPITPVAPALCNALFAATGHRPRRLPLKHLNLRPRR